MNGRTFSPDPRKRGKDHHAEKLRHLSHVEYAARFIHARGFVQCRLRRLQLSFRRVIARTEKPLSLSLSLYFSLSQTGLELRAKLNLQVKKEKRIISEHLTFYELEERGAGRDGVGWGSGWGWGISATRLDVTRLDKKLSL